MFDQEGFRRQMERLAQQAREDAAEFLRDFGCPYLHAGDGGTDWALDRVASYVTDPADGRLLREHYVRELMQATEEEYDHEAAVAAYESELSGQAREDLEAEWTPLLAASAVCDG